MSRTVLGIFFCSQVPPPSVLMKYSGARTTCVDVNCHSLIISVFSSYMPDKRTLDSIRDTFYFLLKHFYNELS